MGQGDLKPKLQFEGVGECWECNEQGKALAGLRFSQFGVLRETLEDNLSFVYSALGLLVDNALLVGAKETRILFNHTFKEKYCLIEDNGSTAKMWPGWQEFVSDMLAIRTYIEENIDQLDAEDPEEDAARRHIFPENNSPPHPPANILNAPPNKETREQREQKEREAKDKEMEKELKRRKRAAKENAKKKKEDRIEYSRNLKLGALRIGDKLLFVSRYGSSLDNRRVLVIEGTEGSYQGYYYVYENGGLAEAGMEGAKKYIDEEYKAYFKIVNDRKEHANNFVFVAGLRQVVSEEGSLEPELKESNRHNDIFCCERRMLETLEDGILWDSMDISLKNYLAMLYLKSDDMKIFLSINDHRTLEINNSDLFDKIDSLVKSERLIDLMPALDLSNCNIIEVYYNKTSGRARELNRKSAAFTFLNGVLFYRRNRLVARYKYPFGEVNKLLRYKPKAIQQMLMMFGFIEIKA
jgi:hypothetical protein